MKTINVGHLLQYMYLPFYAAAPDSTLLHGCYQLVALVQPQILQNHLANVNHTRYSKLSEFFSAHKF